MRHKIVLKPNIGINFDGLFINFSVKSEEIESIFGLPSEKEEERLYYDNKDLTFEFDKQNRLIYIGFGLNTEGLSIYNYDIDQYYVSLDEFIDMLLEHTDDMETINNGNNSSLVFLFKDICIRLAVEFFDDFYYEDEKDKDDDINGKYVIIELGIGTNEHFYFKNE